MRQPARGTVLVVDDDDAIRDAIADVLEEEGFCVSGTRRAQDALVKLRAGFIPDAILLDLWMPGMDGWQFREELEREPTLAEIPVILLTAARGHRREELRVAAIVHKPLSLDELIAALEAHCVQPATTRPSTSSRGARPNGLRR